MLFRSRILDTKILQISKKEKRCITEVDNVLLTQEHSKELKELELDIVGLITLINLSKKINLLNIKVLSEMFSLYSEILLNYKGHNELSSKINILAMSLDNVTDSTLSCMDDISVYLESFIYVLQIWRESMLENKITKALEQYASLIDDVDDIVLLTDNKSLKGAKC